MGHARHRAGRQPGHYARAAAPAPQDTGTIDAPVYENATFGVSIPRPFEDWVFEPGTGRRTATVIFHPKGTPLSDQLWGALILTAYPGRATLAQVAEQRLQVAWRSQLGGSLTILARDSLTARRLSGRARRLVRHHRPGGAPGGGVRHRPAPRARRAAVPVSGRRVVRLDRRRLPAGARRPPPWRHAGRPSAPAAGRHGESCAVARPAVVPVAGPVVRRVGALRQRASARRLHRAHGSRQRRARARRLGGRLALARLRPGQRAHRCGHGATERREWSLAPAAAGRGPAAGRRRRSLSSITSAPRRSRSPRSGAASRPTRRTSPSTGCRACSLRWTPPDRSRERRERATRSASTFPTAGAPSRRGG